MTVPVFLLLWDSMKVFERERERQRVVERRFWLVRGSNLWVVVLVSIYRERRNGRVRWVIGRVGPTRKVGAKKEKTYNVLDTKSKWKKYWDEAVYGLIYADGYSFLFLGGRLGVNCEEQVNGSTARLFTSTVGLSFVFEWLRGNWLLTFYFLTI